MGGKAVTMEEWAELKPKSPTGVLPYAEMPDGTIIAESGAIGRVIAGSCGLLGEGNDFAMSEMLVGMTADLNKKVMAIIPTAFTIDTFDESKKAAFTEGTPGVMEFLQKFPKFMKGDK